MGKKKTASIPATSLEQEFLMRILPYATDTAMLTYPKIQELVTDIPRNLTANDLYNNPFYESTLNLLKPKVLERQNQDQKDFDAELAQRNLLGGSYDAYRRSLLNRDFRQELSDTESQARQESANAYQTQFQNRINALSTLQGQVAGDSGIIEGAGQLRNQRDQVRLGYEDLGFRQDQAAKQASKKRGGGLLSALGAGASLLGGLFGR